MVVADYIVLCYEYYLLTGPCIIQRILKLYDFTLLMRYVERLKSVSGC